MSAEPEVKTRIFLRKKYTVPVTFTLLLFSIRQPLRSWSGVTATSVKKFLKPGIYFYSNEVDSYVKNCCLSDGMP